LATPRRPAATRSAPGAPRASLSQRRLKIVTNRLSKEKAYYKDFWLGYQMMEQSLKQSILMEFIISFLLTASNTD
jgi:hypothetical protein